MPVTYLAWATAAGVKIYSDTYVEQVLIKNGRAVGVSGRVIDPKNQAVIANIKVNAQIVVSSAGAIQTPLLLQRSKLPNRNNQLGRNLSLHPTSVVLGKFPVPVYGWRGAFTGMHIDEFLGEKEGKMLMESGLASASSLPRPTISERISDERKRGLSSVGRAPALQAGCQRFDSVRLHHLIVYV